MEVQVNYVAVLFAVVASMVVGFAWYSPVLFGKQWMKLMGLTKENMESAKKEMGKMYGISFVITIVTAFVLTHVMAMSENFFHYPRLQTGLISAFWMWLGFVMPVQVTDVLFGGRKWNLFAINTGYQLASLLAMGAVLGMM
jgi:ABC-type multidrug transport system permease subunit